MFRFAHLSDLHFSHITWNLAQLFSKRLVGNVNWLLRRRSEFDHQLLLPLYELLVKERVEFVLISGDMSCSSLHQEFVKAKHFTSNLEQLGIPVISIPGNHDHYTKESSKKRLFYQFFEEPSLYQTKVSLRALQEPWHLLLLDTTHVTPYFCCYGTFTKTIENALHSLLQTLPADAKVIVANHFPLKHRAKPLRRSEELCSLLQQYPQIKLYLHGHTHTHTIHDYRPLHLPVCIDAGSAAHKHRGSFTVITCTSTSTTIQPYSWSHQCWTPTPSTNLFWS